MFHIDDFFGDPTDGNPVDQALEGLYQRAFYFTPSKSGLEDDWPRFWAAMEANAYQRSIVFRKGTYLCKSQIPSAAGIPSGTQLIFEPGVQIVSALPQSGNPVVAPFFANVVTASTAPRVTATNTVGTKTIQCDTSFAAGTLVQVLNSTGQRGNIYTVKSVAGGGPFTLTLDRPVLFPFSAGDLVYPLVSRPSDIRIIGNGVKISGTAGRFIEMPGAYRCILQDISIDASQLPATALSVSIDIANYNSVVRRLIVDGGDAGIPLGGIAIESGEKSIIEDCVASRFTCNGTTGYGITLWASAECEVRKSFAWGNTMGVAFVADSSIPNNTQGCFSCAVHGGGFNGNTNGVYVGYGAFQSKLSNVDASYNATGLKIDSATGNVLSVLIDNLVAKGNSSQAVLTTAATPGIVASQIDATDCPIGLNLSSDFECDRLIANSGWGVAAIYINTASLVRVRDASLLTASAGATIATVAVAGATLYLSGRAEFDAANCVGVDNAGGEVYASDLFMNGSGAASAKGFNQRVGGQTHVGQGVDVSALGTFFANTGGKVSMTQGEGVMDVSTLTGTKTLSQKEAKSSVIQTAGGLTGALRVDVPPVPGLTYDLFNNNTNAFATTFGATGGAAIAVAQGKRASAYVDSNGNMVRVTADT